MEMLPLADKLSVPWPWFQALLLLTFLLHLLLMNFVLGGSIISLVHLFLGKPLTPGYKSIPTLIALTINLGVPPLLFVQVLYGNLFYTSSIIIAWPWILIIPLLIIAYYGAYIFVYKATAKPLFAKISLSLSTVLLLLIGFVFVNNITLMLVPERWQKYFADSSGWNLNLGEITLLPRYLHFITASIALAGIGIALYAHYSRKMESIKKAEEIKQGLRIFSFATMVQVIIGTWFLIALPKNLMMQFMGQNILFTFLLIIAYLITTYIIFNALKGKLQQTLYLLLALLVIMIFIRDFVRRLYLTDVFQISALEVRHEYGSMILFLISFAVGIAAICYMVKLLVKSFKS